MMSECREGIADVGESLSRRQPSLWNNESKTEIRGKEEDTAPDHFSAQGILLMKLSNGFIHVSSDRDEPDSETLLRWVTERVWELGGWRRWDGVVSSGI